MKELKIVLKENYEKNKHKVGKFDYNSNINNISSVNSSFSDWNILSKYIQNIYNNYDAFIIIINSDTLLYSSAALAFIIESLDKPIIFTDGNNVFSSLLLTSRTKIPEVMISSNNNLYRGVKSENYEYNGFYSPNYSSLTEKNCLVNNKSEQPKINFLSENLVIPIIKVFPGIDENYMKTFINNDNINGIIIELWKHGTSPMNIGFLKSIKELTEKGIIIVCTTDVKSYTDNIDIRLLEAGCLYGGNITIYTAYIKLSFLLSNIQDKKIIGKLLEINFRGEL